VAQKRCFNNKYYKKWEIVKKAQLRLISHKPLVCRLRVASGSTGFGKATATGHHPFIQFAGTG